jgi:predicted nucleic acid-binding Zn ribbon protein
MADRETEHECDNCGKNFTVINHDDADPIEMCPYCGADIDNTRDDEEDDD